MGNYRLVLGDLESQMRQVILFHARDDRAASKRFEGILKGDWGQLWKYEELLAQRGEVPESQRKPNIENRSSKTYRLKFSDDGVGCEKVVDFDAVSERNALEMLQSQDVGRWAELWLDNKVLCRVKRVQDGLFSILPD